MLDIIFFLAVHAPEQHRKQPFRSTCTVLGIRSNLEMTKDRKDMHALYTGMCHFTDVRTASFMDAEGQLYQNSLHLANRTILWNQG